MDDGTYTLVCTRARAFTHTGTGGGRGTEDCQSIRASRPGIRQLGVVTFPEQSPHHPRPRVVPLQPLRFPHAAPHPHFHPRYALVNESPPGAPDPASAIWRWTGNAAGRGEARFLEARERRRAAIGRDGRPGHAHRAGVRVRDVV